MTHTPILYSVIHIAYTNNSDTYKQSDNFVLDYKHSENLYMTINKIRLTLLNNAYFCMCVCLQMMLKTFKIGACVVSSQIPSVSYIPYLKNTLLVVFPDHTLFTVDGLVLGMTLNCIPHLWVKRLPQPGWQS